MQRNDFPAFTMKLDWGRFFGVFKGPDDEKSCKTMLRNTGMSSSQAKKEKGKGNFFLGRL